MRAGLVGCGILAAAVTAVAVPVGLRVRAQYRTMSCLANMKQIAGATLCYAQDWDGRLPPRPRTPVARTLAKGHRAAGPLADYFAPDDWHRLIYMPDPRAFVCPATRSIYSYELNPALYGAKVLMDQPPREPMQYEAGFPSGWPPPPHRGGYMISYCDGYTKWMPAGSSVTK